MDTNRDKSREHSISDESSNSAEQMVTSPVKCDSEQDAIQIEDSCPPIDNKTEELTDNETDKVPQSETLEKESHVSISFCAIFESEEGAEQVQASSENPDEEKFESLAKPTDTDSPKTSLRTKFPEYDLPSSMNPKVIRPEVQDRYEKNLKKFFEDTESRNEIRSRKKAKISEKTNSEGELSKIRDELGSMSKISTVLSKISLQTSSAPPTFSTVSGQIPENERLSSTLDNSESDTSNAVPVTNKTTPKSRSPKPLISGKTENDSSQVLDSSQIKSSEVFIIPKCIKTKPDETPKKDSPGTSKIKESATTPLAVRPRDFNIETRKTFYTFSPNSNTGVLRQCQSLPNINRPQRKLEIQRRSLILGQHSRIVRSLFSDEPEASTSERREPAIANIKLAGDSKAPSSRDKPKSLSKEESSLPRESHTASQLDRKPKMCRKLNFTSPPRVECQKAEFAQESSDARKGKSVSPVKRKEISRDLVECSSSSVKKIRIESGCKRSDKDTSNEKVESTHSASKEVTKEYLEPACSSGEKVSPVKRKAQEIDEGSISSKTKVKPSEISRL